ncbi:MAG: hypothetical protein JNL60_07395 [Bacteroidia bacterium]|nr:hypothetical protein [Bacteroidia bacterium]
MTNSIAKYHSILDYIVSAILVLPWIFNSHVFGIDSWVLGLTGLTICMYSLVTDYKGSIAKIIPMRVHHIFDLLSGLLLALSPVMFTLEPQLWYLPGIIGLIQITTALFPGDVQAHTKKRFKMT